MLEQGDVLWKNFITADESWIYCYDSEAKQQITEWVEKMTKTPQAQKSAAKTMGVTFFN